MLGNEGRKQCIGYCDLQGIFLAAREKGQLDEFYQAKMGATRNILPNF